MYVDRNWQKEKSAEIFISEWMVALECEYSSLLYTLLNVPQRTFYYVHYQQIISVTKKEIMPHNN